MSPNNPVWKYLSNTLDRACATMIGSSLAGFCCVSTAVHLGFNPVSGVLISIILASQNTLMIYRAGDIGRNDENITLGWRIVGAVIGLIIPVFFLLLGVYAAYITIK